MQPFITSLISIVSLTTGRNPVLLLMVQFALYFSLTCGEGYCLLVGKGKHRFFPGLHKVEIVFFFIVYFQFCRRRQSEWNSPIRIDPVETPSFVHLLLPAVSFSSRRSLQRSLLPCLTPCCSYSKFSGRLFILADACSQAHLIDPQGAVACRTRPKPIAHIIHGSVMCAVKFYTHSRLLQQQKTSSRVLMKAFQRFTPCELRTAGWAQGRARCTWSDRMGKWHLQTLVLLFFLLFLLPQQRSKAFRNSTSYKKIQIISVLKNKSFM